MSISRRTFSGNALALAFASAMFDTDSASALGRYDVSSAEAPHDAYEFWNGFFDSVNSAARATNKEHAQGLRVCRIQRRKPSICTIRPTKKNFAMPPTSIRRNYSIMTAM